MSKTKTVTLHNVPEDKVGEISQSFVGDGASEVNAIINPDGSWDIHAIFH